MQYFFVDLFWAEINLSFKRSCVQMYVFMRHVSAPVLYVSVLVEYGYMVFSMLVFMCACAVCSSGMYLCQWQCSDTFLCEYIGIVFSDKSVCVTLCVLSGLLWLHLFVMYICMIDCGENQVEHTHTHEYTHTHMRSQLLWWIVHESSKYKYMHFIFIVK